jgi:predicted small secreted protein
MKKILSLLLLVFALAACGETSDQAGNQIGQDKSNVWDSGRWDQAQYH